LHSTKNNLPCKKEPLSKRIKAIIKEFGNFTTADVQAQSSPSIASLGGTNQLAESFNYDKAEIVTYDRNDEEVGNDNILYEDLKKDVLEEILALAEDWEVTCLQDEDRQTKD